MKKLASLIVLLTGLFLSGRAQTMCNASLTWTQTANSYNIVFTNTSTVSPAMPPSASASAARIVRINGQYHASNPTYTHNFPGPGSYPVVAYVSYLDSVNGAAINCSDTTQYTVVVTQQPCAVAITTITGSGLSRTFIANNWVSTPGTTYSWNFGDGSPAVTGVTTTHTYAGPGTYIVVVTAMGNGCTSTAADTSTILGSAPLNCANVSTSFTVGGNTNGFRTFLPSSTPNSYFRTHLWNFGNGNTAISYGSGGVSNTFMMAGTYNVCLVTTWTDSANNISCADTVCQNVTITTGGNGNFNCSSASTSFSGLGQQGGYVAFSPIITPSTTTGVTVSNQWIWGDGSSSVSTGAGTISHHYQQSGTYNVCLVTRWMQSGTTIVLCADTFCQSATYAAPNIIHGYVLVDSMIGQPADTFTIWLISYNSTTSMLTAVDSVKVWGSGAASFQFINKPAGVYRTKAHKLYQTAGALGYVPTYRDSSLIWSNAQTFNHNNGQTYSGAIYLRHGLATAGPGFVSGSVLSGANRSTADGDPVMNQLVFLRDAMTGLLVQSAYTNSAGQYSFSNVPLGSYRVYPEEMNYATTASAPLILTSASASVSGILFKKDDADMDIRQVTMSVDEASIVEGGGVSVTPNPADGWVEISVAGATRNSEVAVRISSVAGQTVYRGKTTGAQALRVDVRSLPAGFYTATVVSGASSQTVRLVIRH